MSAKTLIHNALIVGESGKPFTGWLLFCDDLISDLGKGKPESIEADEIIDFEGDLLMPGMIDTHVHFREPGLTRKATIRSESAAAVAGGVTSYFDMPNTIPPTTSLAAWEEKMAIAAQNSYANYAFYIGATNSNLDSEIKHADFTKIPGIKLFLGSSTGNLLVDSKESLERLFSEVKVPIAVHAEDNTRIKANAEIAREAFGSDPVPVEFHPYIRDSRACLDSTLLALSLAEKYGTRLHICHISTGVEAKLLRENKPEWLTAETGTHYLHFADSDYETLGTRIKCNPAIKSSTDRSALKKAVKDGIIDIIASDHAPHLISEKEGDALSAPSGMPGIQFQLPLLLDMYAPELVAKVASANPAKIFKIDRRGVLKPGNFADLIRVRKSEHTISDSDCLSLCGWTPLAGTTVNHIVKTTWVNGSKVFDNNQIIDKISSKALTFKN